MDKIFSISTLKSAWIKLEIKEKDLTGKVVLITGGNEGIGYHTAIHLARMNPRIIIASRNTNKSVKAVESIKKISGNDKVEFRLLDLGSIKSTKDFAEDFKNEFSTLDLLINNADTSFIEYGATQDGLKRTLHINHLGPFVLTLGLLPIIEKANNPRIINLSSNVHTFENLYLPQDLNPNPEEFKVMKEYAKSKLMNVLFTKELSKIVANKNIIVAAVNPGFVKSNLGQDSTTNPILKIGIKILMFFVTALLARSGEEGAKTTVFAAVDDSVKTGEYYDACAVGKVQPQGHDEKLALQLWVESANLVNLDPSIV